MLIKAAIVLLSVTVLLILHGKLQAAELSPTESIKIINEEKVTEDQITQDLRTAFISGGYYGLDLVGAQPLMAEKPYPLVSPDKPKDIRSAISATFDMIDTRFSSYGWVAASSPPIRQAFLYGCDLLQNYQKTRLWGTDKFHAGYDLGKLNLDPQFRKLVGSRASLRTGIYYSF